MRTFLLNAIAFLAIACGPFVIVSQSSSIPRGIAIDVPEGLSCVSYARTQSANCRRYQSCDRDWECSDIDPISKRPMPSFITTIAMVFGALWLHFGSRKLHYMYVSVWCAFWAMMLLVNRLLIVSGGYAHKSFLFAPVISIGIFLSLWWMGRHFARNEQQRQYRASLDSSVRHITADVITKIKVDELGRLCVTPELGTFNHVCRAALDVKWDIEEGFLYMSKPSKLSYACPYDQCFKQIVAAVKGEHGCDLRITHMTQLENIDSELKDKLFIFEDGLR